MNSRNGIGLKPSIHALFRGDAAESRASACFPANAILSIASV
jgi:hypothetical protein